MKSGARLDSAVFQFTPTRTRCDLVICLDGKKEKIASGLSHPFLAHLKSAQNQIAKGGYSITLQPDPDSDSPWFTKDTLERFVRFVSTPEILERVNTIESEILQIEEAMAMQSNESLGSTTQVEVHQKRLVESLEGSTRMGENDADKAIVLYKPESDPPQTNGSKVETENSKVQLMRVLEGRRSALQREQGMAFARAVAAGFDVDHVSHLVSFSECFGAARLREACVKFMDLWKGKHETGQWLEIETAEALSMRSDLPSINVPGIEGHDDKKAPGNLQVPLAPHDCPQGRLEHPMLPQWPVHSLAGGAPVFPSYPIQGMPFYPNYPSGSEFFRPPYGQMENPRYKSKRKSKKKKHSSDSEECKESSDDSEAEAGGISSIRSPDRSEEGEVLEGKSSRRRSSTSGKKRSGTVVIRNINYITSKRHSASGSEHESDSNSEMEQVETGNSRKHGNGSSKNKAGQAASTENMDLNEGCPRRDTNTDNWQVFQSFLLRNEQNTSSDADMFSSEKGTLAKQKQLHNGIDPILPPNRDSADIANGRNVEFDTVNGVSVRKSRQMGPDAELVSSSGQKTLRNNWSNVEFQEMEGRRAGYQKANGDDFILHDREMQPNSRNSLDPLAENVVGSGHGNRSPRAKIADESFLVPLRSLSEEQSTASRGAFYMDTVTQSNTQETCPTDKTQNQACYEPDDLSLMPERGLDSELAGHTPAAYYDMEMHANKTVKSNGIQEVARTSMKGGTKQDKVKKTRPLQTGQERKPMEAARRSRPSKLNPVAEAQARAEKLRAFKANLQKVKREKEQEEVKRLEALKKERQRRISARGPSSSSSHQQGTTPLQNRSHAPPTKSAPNLHRGSKFHDSEPTSASPLQKPSIRRASTGSTTVSQKSSATSKLSSDRPSRNGLSRLSETELKKENNKVADKKAISTTRRLSEPKGGVPHRSSLKSASAVPVSKPSASDSKRSNNANSLLLNSRKADRLSKKNTSEEPQSKKISAIINLDKSKAAALPELKLRIPTNQVDVAQTKPDAKSTEKVKTPNPEISQVKIPMEKALQSTDGDEGLVIEKTVVILEKEKLSGSVTVSEERTNRLSRMEAKKESDGKVPRGSPLVAAKAATQDPVKGLSSKQPAYKAVRDNLQKPPSTFNQAEKPYQAPHARLSSMESIDDFDRSGALPTASHVVKNGPDISQAPLSNFAAPASGSQPLEVSEKPRSKESKGLKRLLKFGKKNQNSSNEEQNLDLCGSTDGNATVRSSSPCAVPSLKHLISEEDSNIGSAPPKASRTFSILSPFRIKSGEKKITV